MAFNPFHSFRKNAKVWFAILTIVCMFTFILSFGRGDAFEWLLSKFGGSARQGEVVTTLYGKKVYDGELQLLRYHRHVANEFVQKVIEEGSRQALDRAIEHMEKGEPREGARDRSETFYFRDTIGNVVYEELLTGRLRLNQKQNEAIFGKEGQPNRQATGRLQAIAMQMQQLSHQDRLELSRDSLVRLLRTLEKRKMDDEARLVANLIAFRDYELFKMHNTTARNKGEVNVFGGSDKRQDLLDLRMWLHQADTLGIRLTQDDIRKEINRFAPQAETLVGSSGPDAKKVAELYNTEKGSRAETPDLDTVYKAVGEELRASLAQAVITGREPGLRGRRGEATVFLPPRPATPADYLAYFRDNRTALKATLLPIPVESFLDQVKESPSEKELEEFFKAHRDTLPRPWSSSPAFKQPHRVRIEWVSTYEIPEEAFRKVGRVFPMAAALGTLQDVRRQHYLAEAARQLPAQKELWGGRPQAAAAALVGTQPLGAAVAGAVFSNRYEPYVDQYDLLKHEYKLPSLLEGDPAAAYLTALRFPEVQGALALSLAGGGGHGNPLNALAAYQASSLAAIDKSKLRVHRAWEFQRDLIKEDRTRRARVIASLVGSSRPVLNGLGPWALANSQHDEEIDWQKERVKLTAAPLPSRVPLEAILFQVEDAVRQRRASSLATDDVREFARKLNEARSDPDEARKVIREAVKKYHLTTGGPTALADQYTLMDDPEMGPVRRLFDATREGPPDRERDSDRIKQAFMNTEPIYAPQQPRDSTMRSLLWWKTENRPARTPETYSEVRAQVERAWKLRQARKLALQKAEEVRRQLTGKTPKEAEKLLAELRATHPDWGKLVKLTEAARRVALPTLDPNSPRIYDTFKVSEDQIPYAPANLLTVLLDLKAGAATVVKDRPEQTVYVAYVDEKTSPATPAEVLKDVGRFAERDQLYQLLAQEQGEKYRERIVAELRRLAGKVDPHGRFALNPGIKSDEGSTDTSTSE